MTFKVGDIIRMKEDLGFIKDSVVINEFESKGVRFLSIKEINTNLKFDFRASFLEQYFTIVEKLTLDDCM